jgi:hypothetical protein
MLRYQELYALDLKRGDKVVFKIDKHYKEQSGVVIGKRTKTVSGGKFFNGRYWQDAERVKQLEIKIQPDGVNYTIGETEFFKLEVKND